MSKQEVVLRLEQARQFYRIYPIANAVRSQFNSLRWCGVPISRRLSRQALPVMQVQSARIGQTRLSLVQTDKVRKRYAKKTLFPTLFNNKTTLAEDYSIHNQPYYLIIAPVMIFMLSLQQKNLKKMKIEYNNLYTHFVFTTLNRQPIILEKFRDRIEKYITGIVNNNSCKMYSIYANPEHVHFLVSRAPCMDEETLATIVANSSEKFINDNHLCVGIFQWQQSCSAFSVSKRSIDNLCEYIKNQKEHHKKQSYTEEYGQFVKFYQQTIHKTNIIR